jgi:hypothetical protein
VTICERVVGSAHHILQQPVLIPNLRPDVDCQLHNQGGHKLSVASTEGMQQVNPRERPSPP